MAGLNGSWIYIDQTIGWSTGKDGRQSQVKSSWGRSDYYRGIFNFRVMDGRLYLFYLLVFALVASCFY